MYKRTRGLILKTEVANIHLSSISLLRGKAYPLTPGQESTARKTLFTFLYLMHISSFRRTYNVAPNCTLFLYEEFAFALRMSFEVSVCRIYLENDVGFFR